MRVARPGHGVNHAAQVLMLHRRDQLARKVIVNGNEVEFLGRAHDRSLSNSRANLNEAVGKLLRSPRPAARRSGQRRPPATPALNQNSLSTDGSGLTGTVRTRPCRSVRKSSVSEF